MLKFKLNQKPSKTTANATNKHRTNLTNWRGLHLKNPTHEQFTKCIDDKLRHEPMICVTDLNDAILDTAKSILLQSGRSQPDWFTMNQDILVDAIQTQNTPYNNASKDPTNPIKWQQSRNA